MDVKKIALIGAIALIVIGCVLAAGCTSTTTTQQTASDDLKQVTGQWLGKYTYEGTTYNIIQTIKADATGYWVVLDNHKVYGVYTSKFSNFDGKGNFEKTSSDGITYKMTYANDTLKETGGDIPEEITYTRMDPVIGIWFNEGTLTGTDKAKFTRVFRADGTGVLNIVCDDGTVKSSEFTWKNNNDGTYTIATSLNTAEKVTMGKDSETLTFVGNGYSFEQKKKFTDSFYNLGVLGPWYDTTHGRLHIFNGDGTLLVYKDSEVIEEGTWTMDTDGKVVIHYTKGTNPFGEDLAGRERTWTCNFDDGVLETPQQELCVRPLQSVANLVFEEVTAEPIVGVWFCDADSNGLQKAKVTAVLLADGTGYSMESGTDGTATTYTASWKKNTDGTYDVKWSNGKTETFTLNSAKDVATSSYKSKFVKNHLNNSAGAVLGAWYCKDNGNVTVFNSDSTGFKKSVKGLKPFTWESTGSGTFTITYTGGVDSDGVSVAGQEREWTCSADNTTITSPSGDVYTRPVETIKDILTVK